MTDIELVIKIPEEIRLALINNIQLSQNQQSICDSCIKQAIVNATPLPKGHGKLIDKKEVEKMIEEAKVNSEHSRTFAENIIKFTPTVIEADKAEKKEIKESDILEVTLLSIEEAIKIPKEIQKAECSWWLRSPGISDRLVAFVFGDYGYVYAFGSNIGLELGVRPALKLKSSHLKSGDSFSYRGYDWDMITDDMALCKTIVGECAFREDCGAADANEYESSDIKKWLVNWWKESEKGKE